MNNLDIDALFLAMYGEIKDNPLPVDEFIKQHTHIRYCEAIMDREGLICYVKPNHVNTLIRLMGLDESIYDEIPVTEAPIYWLLEKSGFVALWFHGYMSVSEMSGKQKEAIDKLITSGTIEDGRINIF